MDCVCFYVPSALNRGRTEMEQRLKTHHSVLHCQYGVSFNDCIRHFFGKWPTQIFTGFLKACYYDYSLHKCADREKWLLGDVQNDKAGPQEDFTVLRSAERSEILFLG